jgi:hypothetical protein
MNSFKKIALAVVAAMTLGTLGVAPASASPMTVALTVNGAATATAGTAAATAVALPVPADNSVDSTDALRIVATVAAGTSVSVTTKNALIVADTATIAAPVNASSGTTSRTIATGTGTTATFFVYTTTTAIGEVTVNNQGTTFTYYVQGTAGKINRLAVTAPTAAPASTQQTITVAATDVFGNLVSAKSVSARVFGSQGTLETATVTTGATLADFGVATFKLTLPATGRSLVEFSVTTASDAAISVAGLTAPALTPFAEITVRDLASELAAKNAELAAEKAALAAEKAALAAEKAAHEATKKAAADAASASAKALADAVAAKDAEIAKLKTDNAAQILAVKKAYNKLVLKWNKANPRNKVKLLK